VQIIVSHTQSNHTKWFHRKLVTPQLTCKSNKLRGSNFLSQLYKFVCQSYLWWCISTTCRTTRISLISTAITSVILFRLICVLLRYLHARFIWHLQMLLYASVYVRRVSKSHVKELQQYTVFALESVTEYRRTKEAAWACDW